MGGELGPVSLLAEDMAGFKKTPKTSYGCDWA